MIPEYQVTPRRPWRRFWRRQYRLYLMSGPARGLLGVYPNVQEAVLSSRIHADMLQRNGFLELPEAPLDRYAKVQVTYAAHCPDCGHIHPEEH